MSKQRKKPKDAFLHMRLAKERHKEWADWAADAGMSLTDLVTFAVGKVVGA